MATSITTQSDVLTYGLITDHEIDRLTTDRMRRENWQTLHERAWTKILDYLKLRPDEIEETDLDDTSELTVATVYMVLHYAYAQAEIMGDSDQQNSQLYWDRAMKELAEVRLTVSGSEVARSSYAWRRTARA